MFSFFYMVAQVPEKYSLPTSEANVKSAYSTRHWKKKTVIQTSYRVVLDESVCRGYSESICQYTMYMSGVAESKIGSARSSIPV